LVSNFVAWARKAASALFESLREILEEIYFDPEQVEKYDKVDHSWMAHWRRHEVRR
jgi:hypothetical protein